MLVWDQIVALFDYAQGHLAVTLVAVFVGTLALSFLHATLTPPPKPAVYKCVQRRCREAS
jgi:ABC-type transport system involved in cytochrome c biogenesis permease component